MKKIGITLIAVAGATACFGQWTATGADIYNSNTGKVAIGTANPVAKLTVIVPVSTSDGIGDQNAYGVLVSDYVSSSASLRSLGGGVMHLSTDAPGRKIVMGGGQFEQTMSLNPGGNVGIGTTSPAVRLHLKTFGSANTNYGSYTTSDIALTLQNGNATNGNFDILSFGDASGWGVADVGTITNHSNHTAKLFFSTRPIGAGPTQRMVIDENGQVGIAHDPLSGYKLAIGGNMIAERAVVKLQANWPDYVFEKDYSLPSLDEVKSYIDENKHLPEIPSAKEMETKGIDVGEMNMLLLKKVEELTLYVIQLKKEVEELKESRHQK
jgi:hypothetical protein